MKKYLFVTILSCILIMTSCKKSNSNAGSWSFEGVNYSAASAVLTDTALSATSGSATNQGSTLTFFFPAQVIRSGTYRVVNYTSLPLDSNQLYIQFINSSTSFYYFSTGSDSVNAKVTVSGAGRVSVTVPPVYLKSYSAAISDSGQLTASINQQ
jgi:hypothetical protein